MKDEPARAAWLKAIGLEERPAFYLKQVHGTEIVAVSGPALPVAPPQADGWVTDHPGLVLCVYAADCIPLFLWEKSGKAVGVFHAGWRGLAQGMPRRAVEAFQGHYGIPAGDLRAEIGPHIGACCYRVGPETAEQFRQSCRVERDGGTYLDLGKEAADQLAESGVPQMGISGACTSCSGEQFFSYRRDKTDNRMMAVITMDGAS